MATGPRADLVTAVRAGDTASIHAILSEDPTLASPPHNGNGPSLLVEAVRSAPRDPCLAATASVRVP